MAELVASEIRRRVVSHELAAGDNLPAEAELVQEYGISRPTLREAFRILESEALISTKRGSRNGAVVLAPQYEVAARYGGLILQYNGTTLGDVYAARLVIEPASARMASANRAEEDLLGLDAVLAEEEAALTSPAPTDYAEVSSRFHDLIVEMGGNQTLIMMSKVVSEIVEAHNIALARADVEDDADRLRRIRRSHKAHTRVAEHVRAQEADAAESFWRAHLEAAGPFYAQRAADPVLDLFP